MDEQFETQCKSQWAKEFWWHMMKGSVNDSYSFEPLRVNEWQGGQLIIFTNKQTNKKPDFIMIPALGGRNCLTSLHFLGSWTNEDS